MCSFIEDIKSKYKFCISCAYLFGASILLVMLLEYFFQLTRSPWYFIDHFIFGFGFTIIVYAVINNFIIAAVFTLLWSLGNEFGDDYFSLLDNIKELNYSTFIFNYMTWSHLFADLVGIFIAYLVYKRFYKISEVLNND